MGLFSHRRKSYSHFEIAPDEILIDSSNLPNFDVHQFEGRLEKPISAKSFYIAALFFTAIAVMIVGRSWVLQVKKGEAFSILSERNSLERQVIFAPRGVIYDRNGVLLVENRMSDDHPDFPSRVYNSEQGLSHVLGYVDYPKKDKSGNYYSTDFMGKDGVEAEFNRFLTGTNGSKIMEVNALGAVESESTVELPRYGNTLKLSIDSKIQSEMYRFMKELSQEIGFSGGAGAIMDVITGEIISLTNYPEFDSSIMSEGSDSAKINAFLKDTKQPFLDRAVSGLYTPGSVVKPFVAIAALQEKIIDPRKSILSTGSISVPNPYDPEKKTVFNDWKAHGYVDMREALAVSSDVYFYEIGGGFEDQKGLGISNIERYMRLFGFGESDQNNFLLPKEGIIPNPTWKEKVFDGEIWRIGDTYNTSIGQYGFQVTLIQLVRGIAAIANGGNLVSPTIVANDRQGLGTNINLGLDPENLKIVREGMRQAVLAGTAKNLDIPEVKLAAKTGTAEIGSQKKYVNSWITGFFPYDNPKYAFALVMEKGPHENTVGALYVMRRLFEWMGVFSPEYLK